jgi:hypothetical protein
VLRPDSAHMEPMDNTIAARKAAVEKHLHDARAAAARTDLEFIEHAVIGAHPEAGRLCLYVNPADSEYFTSELTDADGAHVTDEVGSIVVFHEDGGHDADGEPISVPVTVYDLVEKAMRTCPSDVRGQLLTPENEDSEYSGRYYLTLGAQ